MLLPLKGDYLQTLTQREDSTDQIARSSALTTKYTRDGSECHTENRQEFMRLNSRVLAGQKGFSFMRVYYDLSGSM